MEEKTCIKCNRPLPIDKFRVTYNKYKEKEYIGRRNTCNYCNNNSSTKKWVRNNRERNNKNICGWQSKQVEKASDWYMKKLIAIPNRLITDQLVELKRNVYVIKKIINQCHIQ